jgi:glycosyltransferase involved in cell wall biosynthesis
MIVDGESGVLFPAGDVSGLLSRLRGLEVRDGYSEMRTAARRRFEQEYTGARNIALLLQIYRGVMAAERQVYPVAVSA